MVRSACLLGLCVLWPPACAAQTTIYRQPLGIYARYTAGCPGGNGNTRCITANVAALLNNPALAGINAFLKWGDLNPSYGSYDWTELADIFGAVDAWNAANPTLPRKNVMLGIGPGFHTPAWVFANMASCDPMFGLLPETNPSYTPYATPNPSLVPANCGYATFLEFEDFANPTELPLPLPWAPYYKTAWATFLSALAQQYGSNPDLVSIEIDGPTASSSEMILPNESNDPVDFYKWNYLLALTYPSSYQNSDQAFIEQWADAVDLFSQTFSGLTLVITTGNGLPNFLMPVLGVGQAQTKGSPFPNYTVPDGFSPVCAAAPQTNIMDCAAEESVVAYFASPQHGGTNLKAIQEDGIGANGVYHNVANLGGFGIRWLASESANGTTELPDSSSYVTRVFGGFQSGGVITANETDLQDQGCNLPGMQVCANLTAEQAFYNFMASFFNDTKFGGYYGPGPGSVVSGTVPLNYLQLYDVDINYATANACDIAGGACTVEPVTTGTGKTLMTSTQAVLEVAAQQMTAIAELPACDLNKDGTTNVADVQLIVNEALGKNAPVDDLNGDGKVNIVDLMIETNAALGRGCPAAQ